MKRTKLHRVMSVLSLVVLVLAVSGNEPPCTPVPVEPPPDCVTDADCRAGFSCVDGVCEENGGPPERCAGPDALPCGEREACLWDRELTGEWGECFAPARYPVCEAVGSFSEGWYWSDTGELIDWAMCGRRLAVCSLIGTRSEGWYVYGQAAGEETRITWDLCAPRCTELTVSPNDPLYDRYEGTAYDNACTSDEDCFTGGCSGEVCSASPEVYTTCDLVPPVRGWCGCVDGVCAWHVVDACLLLEGSE